MSDVSDLGPWRKFLLAMEMVVNSLLNSTTRYIPFYLTYGYHPILSVELQKGDESTNVETLSKSLERTQEVWSQAQVQMGKVVALQKRYYDEKTQGYTIFCCEFGITEYPKLKVEGHSA